jgi:hypothetical protein
MNRTKRVQVCVPLVQLLNDQSMSESAYSWHGTHLAIITLSHKEENAIKG